ncbi:MAG TPA: LuxR C-terminal-related transcriptional regulator [Nitrospiria bacterium]|nr:LuxR C-terminal-related transcriptional regulator [Nitrospiria bacterium]
MALSAVEYQHLLKFIDILYTFSDQNDLLQAACEWLKQTLGLSWAVLVPTDTLTGQFRIESNFLFPCQPEEILQYVLYFSPLDPLANKGWIWKCVNRSPQYAEFVTLLHKAKSDDGRNALPQIPVLYCICARPGAQGTPTGSDGISRGKMGRDFTSHEKETLSLLAPHLSQALNNVRLFEMISECQDIGMIVVGSDGRPSYINQKARLALNGKPIATIPEAELGAGGVVFKTDRGHYLVRAVTRRGSAGRSPGAHPHSKHSNWLSRRFYSKILLLEPVSERVRLRTRLGRFGLSRRQEEITALVLEGLSNREIAGKLAICEQTVKDHLHDVFEKTRVRRRSELITKLIDTPPVP